MFGRRRKVVEESGLECPLCHLKNEDTAAECSRCYYDFHSSASQQTTNLGAEESAGLLDLLTGEAEEQEEEGETIDWTGHSFEMEDVTIDVQQYDDIGAVQVSGAPTFATRLVDTATIGNDMSAPAELLAGDAPENVERFEVPKQEIAAWTETREHRVQLVDPTTGNGKDNKFDLDLDLDDSNWSGASSEKTLPAQPQVIRPTTVQPMPQEIAQTTARTLPPTPQTPHTTPQMTPQAPQQTTQMNAIQAVAPSAPQSTPVQAALPTAIAAPTPTASVPSTTNTPAPAPLPAFPNVAPVNGAAIPVATAVPAATATASIPPPSVLPSLPNGATTTPALNSVAALPPSPVAAPPSSAFQSPSPTPSPTPPVQPTTNTPPQPIQSTQAAAPTAAKSLPPVPTPAPAIATNTHSSASAGVWPWPQQAPFEDRVIAQSIRRAMEAAKVGDKASASNILNEVGPHLGTQWRLLYPIGALMRNLGREAELKNMLNIAVTRHPDDEAVKAAVAKLS
jgi:hypothetical protein